MHLADISFKSSVNFSLARQVILWQIKPLKCRYPKRIRKCEAPKLVLGIFLAQYTPMLGLLSRCPHGIAAGALASLNVKLIRFQIRETKAEISQLQQQTASSQMPQ